MTVPPRAIRHLPAPPRCRGIPIGDGNFSGCLYGYGDIEPLTGPCDCPTCNGTGVDIFLRCGVDAGMSMNEPMDMITIEDLLPPATGELSNVTQGPGPSKIQTYERVEIGQMGCEWLTNGPLTVNVELGKPTIKLHIDGRDYTFEEIQTIVRKHSSVERERAMWKLTIAAILRRPADIELIGEPGKPNDVRETLRPIADALEHWMAQGWYLLDIHDAQVQR